MVSCTVQCFFARRIWILKCTWIMRRIVVCIVALAVAQCAGAIIFTALRIDSNMPPIFLRQMVAPIIWLAGSFLCDLLIVGSMLHLRYNTNGCSLAKPGRKHLSSPPNR
ncbi:hypothetical protein PLICRDRAFT_338850 [Plicaturopsis crispa FD-325 SS-3]|uniref:Uncharacterized protein n=1 Tax=Plicaturopsis crispa FD-325 SS-3 TaxID=944288 RepID=A0A0C9SYW9_PLICR|nr:hypothetical protein PLICRDRAFT_338850 [Plicaturopsis crispa FD-325 SS-3]